MQSMSRPYIMSFQFQASLKNIKSISPFPFIAVQLVGRIYKERPTKSPGAVISSMKNNILTIDLWLGVF